MTQSSSAHPPEAVQALLESSDYGDRIRGLNQLRDLDPAVAYPLLEPMASDSNVRVRYMAVSQLAYLGEHNRDRAIPCLTAALKDPEVDVQAAAADALSALRAEGAYEHLEALYRSTSEWLLQMSILAGLGELGDPRAFDLLVSALDSDNALNVPAAVGSLGELGDVRAVPHLLKLVANPDWQLRQRLAQALGQLDTPEAKQALETMANDPEAIVAEAARLALG
jgi:HEAT repeat protein